MKYDLIIENWNKFLEGKFDFLKKKTFKKPPEEPEEEKPRQKIRLDLGTKSKPKSMSDEWGSKRNPCDPDSSSKRRDLGKHIFHPFNPDRNTEDWECNTMWDAWVHNVITRVTGSVTMA